MAFDFKGSGVSAPRPNNTSSSAGGNYPSSLNNIPRPGGNNPSSIPRPRDTSAARNTGFQNRPEMKSGGVLPRLQLHLITEMEEEKQFFLNVRRPDNER